MLLSTTDKVSSHQSHHTIGTVNSVSILDNIYNNDYKTYIDKAVKESIDELSSKAVEVNADGIIGITTNIVELKGKICCNSMGTLIKFDKKNIDHKGGIAKESAKKSNKILKLALKKEKEAKRKEAKKAKETKKAKEKKHSSKSKSKSKSKKSTKSKGGSSLQTANSSLKTINSSLKTINSSSLTANNVKILNQTPINSVIPPPSTPPIIPPNNPPANTPIKPPIVINPPIPKNSLSANNKKKEEMGNQPDILSTKNITIPPPTGGANNKQPAKNQKIITFF
jgi:uncharacterized protein YbjQ (UPF0145 family)